MPGPTQPWDQSEDPRESTVDLPRLDLAGLADYVGGRPAAGPDRPAGLLEPLPEPDPGRISTPNHRPEPTAFVDPYAGSGVPAQPPTRAVKPRFPAATSAAANPPSAPVPAAYATSVAASGAEPDMTAAANDASDEWDEPAAYAPASTPPDEMAGQRAAQAPVSERPPAIAPPDSLAAETARGRPAGFGPVGRAPAGSLADLRSRLARLPEGHPSSPYDDGGQARPVPTRLKQLELGLPAPERELPDRFERRARADGADHEHASVDHAHPDRPERAESDHAKPDRTDAAPDTEIGGLAAGDDLRHDVTRSATPPRRKSPGDAAVDQESPFPARNGDGARAAGPEWADPYAHGNGHTAAGRPADLDLRPWQAAQAPRLSGLEGLTARSGNGHGNGNTSDHRQRRSGSGLDPLDPAPRDAARRDVPDPLDPAHGDAARRDTVQHQTIQPGAPRLDSGPRRGRQPDASQQSAVGAGAAEDLRALVDRTLASCRTAEGRNVFGSYGSSGLTPAIQRVAAQLPYGGLAPGSEADSLKSPGRLAAKLAKLIERYPGRTPEELAAAISDVVRYAFTFETADYVDGTWLVHRRFKAHGFELEARRNRWESPECKGIFTQWRDPAHRLAFEVQFHTTASWAVAQRTHDAYVLITDPATPPAERARLRARQVAAAATASAPPNWSEIGDFRLDPR
jgi:hypothetical protein